MSSRETHGSEIKQDGYASVDIWQPETVSVALEIGMRGVCNHCETALVKNVTGQSRLSCPDCGYIVGLVIRCPTLQEGGEPGEVEDWPGGKEGWEIDDGRATIDVAVQGEHTGCGTLVNNTKESRFGTPSMCCDGCGDQFGRAAQLNTLVDPVNDVNHLEGE